MEFEQEVPVSPTGQYLNSSVMSFTIFAVMEFEVPIHNLQIFQLVKDLFLPLNPRFSSIMTEKKNGTRKWKPVKVQLEEHIKLPKFSEGKSTEFYDEYLTDYMSKMAKEPLPQTRPLWEIHVNKYQTGNAAGNLIFKLHHSLGDGYSLIGVVLSCLKRVDNPSLPLTFPSCQSSKKLNRGFFNRVSRILSGIINTVRDFRLDFMKGEDDRTPIRSGDDGVEFATLALTTVSFSLDHLKQIKDSLNVTINDVITGIILYGARVYMEGESYESRDAKSSALVLFNTRNVGGYKSVSEMTKPKSKMPWGNYLTFGHVSLPKLTLSNSSNPQAFVLKVHKDMQKKKNSSAVYLTGGLLERVRKYKGPDAAARFIYSKIWNSSILLSNLIGPVEQMALGNHPIKGLYFTASGIPVNLRMTMLSYMGNLRIGIASEKGFIDLQKLKSCVEEAFDTMLKTAQHSTSAGL